MLSVDPTNPTPRPGSRAVHRLTCIMIGLSALALPACTTTAVPAVRTSSGPAVPQMAAIETDLSGRCIGRAITPAVIETVTAQELDQPAILGPDGAVLQPARYRSVIRQNITRNRQEVLFETICPPAFTPEFVATLQRALATRGYYAGPITGVLIQRPVGQCRIISAGSGRTARCYPSGRHGRWGSYRCLTNSWRECLETMKKGTRRCPFSLIPQALLFDRQGHKARIATPAHQQ